MSSRNETLFESSVISSSQVPNDQTRRLSKRFRPSVQCKHINKQTNEQCTADGFMECVHCDEICCLNHITQHQDELKQYRNNLVQCQISNPHPTETTTAAQSRTNGIYIPPVKIRLLQVSLTDKSSIAYQQLAWEKLKKTINNQLNKVNKSNLQIIIHELLKHNIVLGRGLFASAIIKAQIASPFYTHVYAAMVSIINTKFLEVGELICKRLISSFHRTYQRNDKINCLAITRFIAHLVNQNILHGIIVLQILLLLLENPTDDNIEIGIEFIKESGQKLSQISSRGLDSAFSTLTNLLHESLLTKRTKYMIEVLFAVQKDQFKAHPVIQTGLDLVDENDQYTHILQLDDSLDPENMLDVFKYDKEYEINENKYKQIRKRIFDENSDDEDKSSLNSSNSDEEDDANEENQQQTVIDQTKTNLLTLRHTMNLTIQPTIDVEECAHKLLQMNLLYRQEIGLCQIIVDNCAQQHTYEPFFGLLGQRLCSLNKDYILHFKEVFYDQYVIDHPLEYVKLRNMAKFFAYLLATDSISWGVFDIVRLTGNNITSLSLCIYIKNLFLGLFEFLGFEKLKSRLSDPRLTKYFRGLFVCDTAKNARYSINFFTSIGLGRIIDELRELIILNLPPAPPPPMSIYIDIENELDERKKINVMV